MHTKYPPLSAAVKIIKISNLERSEQTLSEENYKNLDWVISKCWMAVAKVSVFPNSCRND